MTPRDAVAFATMVSEELTFEARYIAALCSLCPVDRWMRHNPVTPEEVQALLDAGQTDFPEIRGRHIRVKAENGVLDLEQCRKLHGAKFLDDATALVNGRPNIRI